MKTASIMVILQSIYVVTSYVHLKVATPRDLSVRLSGAETPSTFSEIADVTILEDEYIQRFTNVARLYENNVNTTLLSLRNAHVCVVGLGGVGSWCVEALARSGIGRFSLIDMDDICISNTNRQIQALTSTVGQFKGEALRDRILDINPYARVDVVLDFLRPTNVDSIIAGNIVNITPTSISQLSSPPPEFDDQMRILSPITTNEAEGDELVNGVEGGVEEQKEQDPESLPYLLNGPPKFDFVVDAADGVTDKAFMIDACVRSGTPIVVCGGAGGLIDPTLLRISDMTKVVGDNLIMHVRKKLRQKFGYPQGLQMSATGKTKGSNGKKPKQAKKWNIQTIHTMPTGVKRGTPLGPVGEGNFRKCDVAFGNSCFSTGTVGFLMASVVINSIAGEKGKAIPSPLGFVGRMRGPVPVRGSKESVATQEVSVRTSVLSDAEGNKELEESGVDNTGSDCNCGKSLNRDSEVASSVGAHLASDQSGETVIADAITSVSTGIDGLHTNTILVDSHCHLQLDPLYSRAAEAILTAKSHQIAFAVVCGTCPGEDWNRVKNLYEADPGFVAPQFGLHPWWISRHFESLADVSGDTDSNTERTDSNTERTDGNTERTDSNTERTDGNTERTDGKTERTDGKTERTDGNTERADSNTDPTNKNSGIIGNSNSNNSGNQDIHSSDQSNAFTASSNSVLRVEQRGWEHELENILLAIPAAGVGECGLDRGIKNVDMTAQIDILRKHIRIAARLNRSVTIHCVGAWGQLLEVLKDMEREEKAEKKNKARREERRDAGNSKVEGISDEIFKSSGPSKYSNEVEVEVEGEIDSKNKSKSKSEEGERGVLAYVLHSCNSLSVQMANEFLKIPSVYFSFSGRALSANKEGKLASRIPLNRILVETDSPDQLPLFLRNQLECNEPSLVRLNLGVLASLMKIDPNVLASSATANSILIFKSSIILK